MRVTKQPDVRKQELLDIGVSLYFEIGEKQISIQKVVDEANVATGLFYYYFKSKDQFLDEAINYYIEKEFLQLEKIINNKDGLATEKLEQLLNAYFDYALRMESYRNDDVFKTTRHFDLTEKLIEKLTPKVIELITQGNKEKVFHVKNKELVSSFLLHAITCVFDSTLILNKSIIKELKSMIEINLGIGIGK